PRRRHQALRLDRGRGALRRGDLRGDPEQPRRHPGEPQAGGRHREPEGHRPRLPQQLPGALRGHLAPPPRGLGRRGAPGRAGRPDGGRAVAGGSLAWCLGLSGVLFVLGLIGVIVRRNPLLLLLAVELLLNGANVALVGFSRYWNNTDGQIFALVVMVVAAAEVVIGLGLVVAVFRQRMNLDVDELSTLKG